VPYLKSAGISRFYISVMVFDYAFIFKRKGSGAKKLAINEFREI